MTTTTIGGIEVVFDPSKSGIIDATFIDTGHTPRLRARVHQDGHDSQSYTLIQSWVADLGWTDIDRRPIQSSHTYRMDARLLSCKIGGDDAWKRAVVRDIEELLEYGVKFFGGAS